ncbi:MAG: IS3 family transposase [Merdibacter sp.]
MCCVQEVKKMIDDYIEYYNNERPQWTRMKMTPAAYARYLKEMDEQALRHVWRAQSLSRRSQDPSNERTSVVNTRL